MKTYLSKLFFCVLLGLGTGFAFKNPTIGIVFFLIFAVIYFSPIYRKYSADNPNHLWFKRKLFGWGWVPVSWQGWLVVLLYIFSVLGFALTIDENSPVKEIVFTFLLPVAILTALLIRICYKKGESPKWQWGKDLGKYE